MIGSTTYRTNERFLKETSGSVSVSETRVRQYGAKMRRHDMPAFTNDFVKEIRNLHSNTLVVSMTLFILHLNTYEYHLKSWKNENL